MGIKSLEFLSNSSSTTLFHSVLVGCVRRAVAGCGGVGGRAERPNSYHKDQVCEGDLETGSARLNLTDDDDGRLAVALPSALQG